MDAEEAALEREIQELQKQRKLEEGRLATFGTSVSYDNKIYGDVPKDDYVSAIGGPDEEPDYEDSMRQQAQSIRKLTGNYTAPKNIGKDIPKGDYDEDPFTEFKQGRIIDREDDYKKRRLKRKLSPVRESNPYRERMQETLLEKEHDRVVRLAEKKKEEEKKEREAKLKQEKERIQAELERKQKDEKKRIREEKKKIKKEERRRKRARREGRDPDAAEENEGKKEKKVKKETSKKSWSDEESEEEEGKEDEDEERMRQIRRTGVTLTHTEPPDAKKPSTRYVLHVFKAGQIFGAPEIVYKKSCYRFGKDEVINDIVTAHDSCSKQHAALQWREVNTPEKTEVRAYLIDFSTNGTFVNNKQIKPREYVELKEGDVLKFAFSTRQYAFQQEKIKV